MSDRCSEMRTPWSIAQFVYAAPLEPPDFVTDFQMATTSDHNVLDNHDFSYVTICVGYTG